MYIAQKERQKRKKEFYNMIMKTIIFLNGWKVWFAHKLWCISHVFKGRHTLKIFDIYRYVYKTGKYGKIMPKITRENHFRVFLEDLFIFILIFKMYAKMKI